MVVTAFEPPPSTSPTSPSSASAFAPDAHPSSPFPSHLLSPHHPPGTFVFQNWAGSYRCRPAYVFFPRSVEDVRSVVEWCLQDGRQLKVIGGRHSPSDLACVQNVRVGSRNQRYNINSRSDGKENSGSVAEDVIVTGWRWLVKAQLGMLKRESLSYWWPFSWLIFFLTWTINQLFRWSWYWRGAKGFGDKGELEGGIQLNLEKMDGLVKHDPRTPKVVTLQAGILVSALHPLLASLRPIPLACTCLGSISDQSISGAISTATHGAGWDYPNFSKYVKSMKLVLADENVSVVEVSRDSEVQWKRDLFFSSLCGLGATGIIVEVEMEFEERFKLEEDCWEMKLFGTQDDGFVENWEEVLKSGEHVRCFWYPQLGAVKVFRLNRTTKQVSPPPSLPHRLYVQLISGHLNQLVFFFSRPFPSILPWHANFMWKAVDRPLNGLDYDWRHQDTTQTGMESTSNNEKSPLLKFPKREKYSTVGISNDMFNIDVGFSQYTFEGAIPVSQVESFLTEVDRWLRDVEQGRHHFPIEIRPVAGDDIWLSPTTGGERRIYFGIQTYRPYGLPVPYKRIFQRFEHILFQHDGRAHWAKAHTCSRLQLEKLYPRLTDFLRVREDADPKGIFLNAYLRRHLLGEVGEEVDARRFKDNV